MTTASLPCRAVGRWVYETTAPVVFDTIRGRVVVPPGFRFYVGAAVRVPCRLRRIVRRERVELRLPPLHPGMRRAACLHDWLYVIWADLVAGLYHADAAMRAEMRRHRVWWWLRVLAWCVISAWSAGRARRAAL